MTSERGAGAHTVAVPHSAARTDRPAPGRGVSLPPPRQPLGYRPALDGIRALAILGVIAFHTPDWSTFRRILPGGHMGVTVFFVLSGFLITTLLLTELRDTGDIDLRGFYLRRAARLMPGFLVVAVFHTAFWSTQDGFVKTVAPVLAGLFYTASIFAGFWRLMGKFTWSWSLSVEEHFYFGWPPLLRWLFGGNGADERPVRGLLRRHPMRATAGAALLIVAVATGIRIGFVGPAGWQHDLLYFSTFTRMDALAVGCLAALLAWRYRLPLARTLGWLAVPVLAYSYVSPSFGFSSGSLYLWGLPLGSVATAVLLLSVVQQPRSVLARLLSVRPLVHVGMISYGLYLWNLLPGSAFSRIVGHQLGTVGTLLSWLTILVAVELSYRYVEQPVRRWAKTRIGGQRRPR